MSLPFYQNSATAARAAIAAEPKSANTGLWYTRFYDGFGPDWSVGDEGKRSWIERTVNLGPSGDAGQLKNLGERQQKLCLSLGGLMAELETEGPFVTGMGLSHPVENGFAFHPTLGTPYLPASGVKGLLRGWVEAWMEHEQGGDEYKYGVIGRWFGAAKGDDKDKARAMPEGAGNLIFFDALPTKPVHLACDIMTPHMGKWYEKGGAIGAQDYATTAPADWHNPVPVPFLVVKRNTPFRFLIAPRLIGNAEHDTQAKLDVVQAMKELKEALEWLGAGAKTAAGYGRMVDREAEKAQKAAAGLAAAGITVGEEQWQNAKLDWNKGKATVSVTKDGKVASQSGEEGKAKWMGISEAARKRVDKGKSVLVQARIDVRGNSNTIVSIDEIV